MRWRWTLTAALALTAVHGPAGCTQPQDRLVERANIELAADLRTRGALERTAIERQFETFRQAKHQELDAALDAALKTLEAVGKLDAKAARYAADTFGAKHRELDRLVNLAKAAALEQAKWYDRASDTLTASVEYYQAKDAALAEGAKAALEAFTQSYQAAKRQPADETEAQAQGLMDRLQEQLTALLAARVPGAAVTTAAGP